MPALNSRAGWEELRRRTALEMCWMNLVVNLLIFNISTENVLTCNIYDRRVRHRNLLGTLSIVSLLSLSPLRDTFLSPSLSRTLSVCAARGSPSSLVYNAQENIDINNTQGMLFYVGCNKRGRYSVARGLGDLMAHPNQPHLCSTILDS